MPQARGTCGHKIQDLPLLSVAEIGCRSHGICIAIGIASWPTGTIINRCTCIKWARMRAAIGRSISKSVELCYALAELFNYQYSPMVGQRRGLCGTKGSDSSLICALLVLDKIACKKAPLWKKL